MEQGPLGGNLRPQQPANNRQIRTNVALPAQEVRGVNFRRLKQERRLIFFVLFSLFSEILIFKRCSSNNRSKIKGQNHV